MQTSHRITLQCNFTWGKLWTKALKIPLMFCCWPDLTFALLNLCPKYNRIITFLPFPEGSEKPNIVRFGKSFKLLKVCGVQEFYLTGEWKKSAQLGWVWLQWMSSVQRGTNSPKQKKNDNERYIFKLFFFPFVVTQHHMCYLFLTSCSCCIKWVLNDILALIIWVARGTSSTSVHHNCYNICYNNNSPMKWQEKRYSRNGRDQVCLCNNA